MTDNFSISLTLGPKDGLSLDAALDAVKSLLTLDGYKQRRTSHSSLPSPFSNPDNLIVAQLSQSLKFSVDNAIVKLVPGVAEELAAFDNTMVLFACYHQAGRIALIPYALRAAFHNSRSGLPFVMPSPSVIMSRVGPILRVLPQWTLPDTSFARYLLSESLGPKALAIQMLTLTELDNIILPVVFECVPSARSGDRGLEMALRLVSDSLQDVITANYSTADQL